MERKLLGGTCVDTGCTPTKTLVASAYAAHLARRRRAAREVRDEVKPLGIRVTIVEPGASDFSGEANNRPAAHIAEYDPVVEPVRQYLYGNNGEQPGDPRKAARAMIQAVESAEPPLRLMLGADAAGLWETKRAAMEEDFAGWRGRVRGLSEGGWALGVPQAVRVVRPRRLL
ncbi:MAG TPA: hypothetical protein VIP46_05855 [Pyrinomonadaceae bacterium]